MEGLNTFTYILTFPGGDKMMMMKMLMKNLLNVYSVLGTLVLSMNLSLIHNTILDGECPNVSQLCTEANTIFDFRLKIFWVLSSQPVNVLPSLRKQWFCCVKWIYPLLEIPGGLHLLTCPSVFYATHVLNTIPKLRRFHFF